MGSDHRSSVSSNEVLSLLDQTIKKDFESNRRLLSFDEYVQLIAERPEVHLRGCAEYMTDMMDHYGKTPVSGNATSQESEEKLHGTFRFHLFDFPIEGVVPKLVGQEAVQTQIYNCLRTFVRQGMNNKLILLHGPNGSAKSTIAHAMMASMERYSQLPEGAVYTYSWVFPVERMTKTEMGLHSYAGGTEKKLDTYAHMATEDFAARIPCDLKDHPLLLIPLQHRKAFLEKLVGTAHANELWNELPNSLTKGDLSHRCKQIFETLLATNGGNLKRVLAHIQVERLYYSRRYRNGLATIEPQMHVDAQYQLLSYNKSLASLPSALQNLNLFALAGDLIDGNRGIIEFSDLLKRPVDSFKYLLGACEMGSVNIGPAIAHLDAVMIGSTNELQLDAFKEFPDFSSFKGRIELIRVPYLLAVSQEKEIYSLILPRIANDKPIAPHVAWAAALWAVLTRLKKPNSLNYPPGLNTVISNLTPLEKARLYDRGEIPVGLPPEDRKLLRSNIDRLRNEYTSIPYYEGRVGASPREMQSILFDAAQNPEFPCLSPLAVMRELEEFIKRVTEYDFLKQDVKDGYHDSAEFINILRGEYLDLVDREVRDCMGLYNAVQWEDFLKKYVTQVSSLLKKEKVKNPITGKMEEPDHSLIDELERIVESPADTSELENFRRNVISQVGAWSLDHPKDHMVYAKVFPEFWAKLQKHYYESQKATLTKMHDALLHYGTDKEDPNSDGAKLARQTITNMVGRMGYDESSAREAIIFLMRKRY